MTTRVAALSGAALAAQTADRGGAQVRAVPVNVTPGMVDAAVEDVLRDEAPHIASMVRDMWARDGDSEVAQILMRSAAAAADRARYPTAAKFEANVPYVLTDEQRRYLTELYPEFRLTFSSDALHDHGIAAAVNHAGKMALMSEIPPGMDFVDFGGNEINYVNAGNLNATVVKTILDDKDPTRDTRNRMQLEVIAKRHANATVGTREANAGRMAASILSGEGKYVVRSRLQDFNGQFLVGMMSHVYDVPISEIPLMMERCGMKMFVFTLHFSNRFFDTDSGELEGLGARYRIDRKADLFEFGFVGSGARWYPHKWSEFQRYGADQILCGQHKRYSMKIVRRRGDTIEYRVLEIGGKAKTNVDQYYRLPEVPCVQVTADLSRDTHGAGEKLIEVFPQDVWNRMVRECAADLVRGQLDYHKCVANYAQITAGHTYNGVDAVLGSVPVTKIPVLVALSAASAAGLVMRMRAGVRFGIDAELAERRIDAESLAGLSFKLFYKAFLGGVTAPLIPIAKGFEFLLRYSGEQLLQRMVEVQPVQQVRRIPVDVYQRVTTEQVGVTRDAFPEREYLEESQQMQDFVAEMVQQMREGAPGDVAKHIVNGDEVSSGTSVTMVAEEERPAPPWMPVGDGMEYRPQVEWHGPSERKASIMEEIEIVQQEAHNLEAWMAPRWAEIMATGEPDESLLRRKRDEWKDIDAWYVDGGVIVRSALGRSLNSFKYTGVYCPEVMSTHDNLDDLTHVVRTRLRPVEEHTWASSDDTVQRIHKILAGPAYTGWVLVNDRTVVHNGPLVLAGLRRSLSASMDYDLGVYVGGPGAGKTYDITHRHKPGQQVTSPLVLSVDDVREELVKLGGTTFVKVQKFVRTIDSWLCAAGRGDAMPYCGEILSDEVYNGRAARAYAVWGMMRCRRVVAYGDDRQIPPVDPSGSTRIYPKVMPRHTVYNYYIYRFGPEILALIAHHYDYKLRSVKKPGTSQVVWLDRASDFKPQSDKCLLMAMYQAQLPTMRKVFPALRTKISTTHQAQGKSVREAMIGQFDTRLQPTGSFMDLYNDPCYVNVGVTRAAEKVYLHNAAPKPNLLNAWYEYAQDQRLIRACADVASAGQSVKAL